MDGKYREITDLQKEIERLKEDTKMKETKLKWTQNKLITEMDLQKDTQQKLDKALVNIHCSIFHSLSCKKKYVKLCESNN